MVVDFSPVVQALLGVAALVVSTSGPVIATYVIRRFRLEGNVAAVDAVNAAVKTGGGIAYAALVAESNKPASINIKSASIAAGVSHVIASVPDALAKAGVTQDTVARMVEGKLGELLSADVSVSAGPSASVPPPSLVPVAAVPVL